MKPRIELQKKLSELVANVYFQPPSTVKMKYPAIVYSLEKAHTKHADNKIYIGHFCYTVTFVSTKYDENKILEILDSFEMISLNRTFVLDNLYHTVFNLYY